jgi:hypothetical protein
MTKSNAFLGTRIYFNGGAVTTFGLYGFDGVVQCGGIAYAYGGYAKDDDFPDSLDGDNAHPVGKIETSCKTVPLAKNQDGQQSQN